MDREYYALCVSDPEGEHDIAFLELGTNEFGAVLGMAVYTAPDGELQRKDLEGRDDVVIAPVSAQDLLDAMNRGVPNSVFVDGEKMAGSVFKARLKAALGIPLKRPTAACVRIDQRARLST